MIHRSPEAVFAFYSNPLNLQKVTPPNLHFTVLTAGPYRLTVGTLIDYRMRLIGIPIRWTSRIAEYNPPHRLVEEQTRGVFSSWHHEYAFSPEKSGTRVTETVRYGVPLGFLGTIAHRYFVDRFLNYIFDYRYSVIGHLFKSVV
jgi:hypothetical protein